jgi:hypothetical protein
MLDYQAEGNTAAEEEGSEVNDDEDGEEEGSDEVCFHPFFCCDYLFYQIVEFVDFLFL